MTDKDAYIKQLENTVSTLTMTVENLQKQVDNMTELIRILQKSRFGSSSEKTPLAEASQDQLSMFNEAEASRDPKAEEPAFTTVKGKRSITECL